jgi:hypothetical protein
MMNAVAPVRPRRGVPVALLRVLAAPLALTLVLTLLVAPGGARAQNPPRPWGRLIWADVPANVGWDGGLSIALKTRILYGGPGVPVPQYFTDVPGQQMDFNPADARQVSRLHPAIDYTGLGVLAGRGAGVQIAAATRRVGASGGIHLYRQPRDMSVTDEPYFYPAFHPSGRTAYLTKITPGVDGIDTSLHSLDLVTSGAQIAPLSLKGSYPTPSPDGELIAWIELEQDRANTKLVVATLKDPVGSERKIELKVPGRRRIVRPSWRGDSRALVFASDWQADDRNESWDIYGLAVAEAIAAPQPISMTSSAVKKITASPVPQPGNPASQDPVHSVWPAFSADGQWIACSVKPRPSERYGLVLLRVDENLAPQGDRQDVPAGGGDAMWAAWSQDIVPPSLRVELVPTDSSQSTVAKILPEEVLVKQGKFGTGRAGFTARGAHFAKEMKLPAGAPAPGAEKVAELPFGIESLPVTLGVNVAKEIPYENPNNRLERLTAIAGYNDNGAGYGAIQGLYVNKDVRIVVKVSAKDNQLHRSYPTKPDPADRKVDENTSWFPDDDSRALAPGYAPPYLPLASRASAVAGSPGVAWWWEDERFAPLDGGTNTSELVLRAGNFEGSEAEARPRIVWFRAMANDMWRNRTELAIPVFIYTKSVKFDTLNFGQQRKN